MKGTEGNRAALALGARADEAERLVGVMVYLEVWLNAMSAKFGMNIFCL